MMNLNDITNKLRAAGVTPTAQRMDIAKIIFAKNQHLSAEQILQKVNENSPSVSKATVYNTVGLFVKKGLVREVIVDPSKVFYDSNMAKHFHFYNSDSNELIDITAEEVQIEKLPDLPAGTTAMNVDVIVRIRNS